MERGPNEDFLTSVCEHCEILGWFAPDVHSELNSDFYLPSFNFSEVELNAQKWRTGFTSYLPLQLRELG
jgi:hypothetical protein